MSVVLVLAKSRDTYLIASPLPTYKKEEKMICNSSCGVDLVSQLCRSSYKHRTQLYATARYSKPFYILVLSHSHISVQSLAYGVPSTLTHLKYY